MQKQICLLLSLLLICTFFSGTASAEAVTREISKDISASAIDISSVPDYSGTDYIVLNGNLPDFYVWQITKRPYIRFSQLDELGRTGAGMACLGMETLPTTSRSVIGDIRPSGWHTVRYDDLIEDHYLFNRCHVIAHMLSGDSDTPENLFTGTRYLNSSSMLQFEIKVGDYIEDTGNHVIYRVTPVYPDEDLVATGVQIEAWSVEDNGAGICFNVFVYNIQPGILIDYLTGESERDPNYDSSNDSTLHLFATGAGENAVSDRSRSEEFIFESDSQENSTSVSFILNLNTQKFHLPTCSSVLETSPRNRQAFFGTRDEAIAAGYQPCGRCHP